MSYNSCTWAFYCGYIESNWSSTYFSHIFGVAAIAPPPLPLPNRCKLKQEYVHHFGWQKTKATNVQFTGKLFVVKIWGKKRTNRSFCRNGLEQIIIISPLNEKKRSSNWFDRYCILTRRPNASHLSAYLFVWQFTAIFIYDMRYS